MITVLFARADSVYKALDCDVYDERRDAFTWPGGTPVVAHPPCRLWGRLRRFSTAPDRELLTGTFAFAMVRRWGGVIEHPAGSLLFRCVGASSPGGGADRFGGVTFAAPQAWWGHRANKASWFYVCGCAPDDFPPMPFVLGDACFVVESRSTGRPAITKAEREHTPLALAKWLIDLAARCQRERRAA